MYIQNSTMERQPEEALIKKNICEKGKKRCEGVVMMVHHTSHTRICILNAIHFNKM